MKDQKWVILQNWEILTSWVNRIFVHFPLTLYGINLSHPQQSDRFLEQFLVFFSKGLEELNDTDSKLVKFIFTAKICEKLSVFFVFF
jgi:hypothetical protein